MRRREFIALVSGAIACPMVVRAQQQAKEPRIGYLGVTSPSDRPRLLDAFRQRLRELGWVEGQNIVIDYRFAEGRLDRLPHLAADLVRLKVDVLPRPSKLARGHHPAMPYEDVAGFFAKLRKREATSALALELCILTAGRSGEISGNAVARNRPRQENLDGARRTNEGGQRAPRTPAPASGDNLAQA